MTTAVTILVAEDRENWRKTFCTLLEDMGFRVLEACCGREFEEQAVKADVIVLDISMPMERGGLEGKTVGLEVLVGLQERHRDHRGIQNPIIRSMWERSEFQGSRYDAASVNNASWVSRNEPIADLLQRIRERTPQWRPPTS